MHTPYSPFQSGELNLNAHNFNILRSSTHTHAVQRNKRTIVSTFKKNWRSIAWPVFFPQATEIIRFTECVRRSSITFHWAFLVCIHLFLHSIPLDLPQPPMLQRKHICSRQRCERNESQSINKWNFLCRQIHYISNATRVLDLLLQFRCGNADRKHKAIS